MHDYEVAPLSEQVTIDVFEGVDLRVGKILTCDVVEGTDRLLQMSVDLGPLGTRTIVSGLQQSYGPDDLVSKHVAVFANLEPRKIRGVESHGMILASGPNPEELVVAELHRSSLPGDKVS